MYDKEIVDLFKVMVTDNKTDWDYSNAALGFITNFKPTASQVAILKTVNVPLSVNTLFSVDERKNYSIEYLITKQILHYIEVYGLNSPGLFNLEMNDGVIAALSYIQGVSKNELGDMVRKLLYTNAPVKDATVIKNIIDAYNIDVDINLVKNNELRIQLFRIDEDVFTSGDDAVRWMVFSATGKSLLVKNKYTYDQVKAKSLSNEFFLRHEKQLSEVFLRHKPLILAAKNKITKTSINKIGRLAKINHVPIQEGRNKTFVARAISGDRSDDLSTFSLRDKFKFLNLIEVEKEHPENNCYVIRNGKVWIEKNNKTVIPSNRLVEVSDIILADLKKALVAYGRVRG